MILEQKQLDFSKPERKTADFRIRLLENLGFNGERVTLLKYVVKTDVSGLYISRFGQDVLWEVGQKTEEKNWSDGLIGMSQGLYAAGTSYFIRNRITDSPIFLVEMAAVDFINTDGEVVVSKALRPIDVLPDGLPGWVKDVYYDLSPDRKRALGQVHSWDEFINIIKNSF